MIQHSRLLAFLALVTAVCCCLFGAIFLSDLQRTYDELLAARIGVVAQDVAATVENRANLGLPINYLPDMQSTLELARAQSSGIETVSVANQDGNIIYSTDHVGIGGSTVMPDGRGALQETGPAVRNPGNSVVSAISDCKSPTNTEGGHVPAGIAIPQDCRIMTMLTDQDQVRILVPLRNGFDVPIGAVIMVSARIHLDPMHLAQVGWPFVAAAVFIAMGLVLTFLVARLVLQELELRSRAVAADADVALALALDTDHDGSAPSAGGFLTTRVNEMSRMLHLATTGVQRIDEAS